MLIDADLARRLVAVQFPQWSGLPVRSVDHGGWDNRTFRLGDTMSVRLPSAEGYVPQIDKEHRWLPKLAPRLPVPIPAPIARGVAGEGYPFPWSVYGWIDGETAAVAPPADLIRFAQDVGGFLTALESIDATNGPAPGLHSAYRGGPLQRWDAQTRAAIAALGDRIPGPDALALWDAALAAEWAGRSVWFHGDVAPGNLLVRDGRLAAVIDFGCSGTGDPACDTVIAWTLFEGESRDAFRAALPLDEPTWTRGRGWALWKSVITLAQNEQDRPKNTQGEGQRALDALLAE